MRNRQEMMNLGMKFAQQNEKVRLFTLEGSLTNSNIPKDEYQDYDFSYFVTDMDFFKKSDDWLEYFGKRIMMQKPEAMELFPAELGNWFSYLMIFEDGTKIDLTLIPLEEYKDYFKNSDGLVEVLLDKDDLIQESVIPSDRSYHIQKPSSQSFDDCCNEFWFTATYVAKGLARKEILFAIDIMNGPFRPNLLTMLRWKVGIETNYSLSIGKSDKFLKKYVSDTTWDTLLSTYEMGSYEKLWDSLYTNFDLFREASRHVAERLGYTYPDYDEKVSSYIEGIRQKYFVTNGT
ncbi:aminoglycoside 6-adenylyltransferase [Lederbergia wuyishanensis]|uniref:Aminoglycoside 6-adenylyltransferase n=1 Tax=Lederbergia wuyishanensis TaxID=1347903 RepID=A0ABU0D697_9BACI|nr:aminoglycoside 6-adenylyltransferase [Lederbergia wuyishanensis]MCJ8008640.1 aminoglycoside 6-adenylyltransferase [Lederbergia wuyishanensis]MDQ0343942.1 aminoglycoside 6-adenylyltransferase [Lederbergia wuyishanensis]